MNEIARKLDFSLRRLVSALIIIYFFAAPFASTYASGAVTEVFQEGKKAATRKLTGKIIDKNTKETLIGASVWLKDTSIGGTTDMDGNFNINVPGGKTVTLVISYLGYANIEKEISPSANNLLIEMSTDDTVLEEVQVVGYGTQRKESVIGSISTLSVSNLKVPSASISTNLAGQLGGVVSIQRDGSPGSSAEFWIRGISTFGANKTPLILVDGVERSLDLLDPEEIESFSLLKDATATALYGVRGANGVVLIKTKRGSEGKPKISIKMEAGMVAPTKIPEMADAVDFANMYNGLTDVDQIYKNKIQFYCPNFLCTNGAGNISLRTNSISKEYEVKQLDAVSTVGAGDNFNAGVIYGLLKRDIRYRDLNNIREQDWDEIIGYGKDFSANVCMSLYNSVSKEFATSY